MSETVVEMPNAEALVSAFLRAQAELDALVDGRVYTALPKGVEYPAMRVTQVSELKVTTRPLWVATAQLQVEAWGGSKSDAWRMANLAQGLLDARLEGVHDAGVVNGVTLGPLRDLPDETFTPAKPRWLFVANVTLHPR